MKKILYSWPIRVPCATEWCHSIALRNAEATFWRMMDKVFRNHNGRNMLVYIDDILFKTACMEDHVKDMNWKRP